MRVAQAPTRSTAARTLGWLAVGITLAVALALTLLRAGSDIQPGIAAVGLLGFFAAFAGPGLVAAVGVARGRPELLVASAVVLICLAPLSMAGATLVLLAPAVILLYVARRMPASGSHPIGSVVVTLLTIGLLVAAPIGLFTTTQVVCWEDYGGGNVVVQVLPEMPTESSSVAPFGGGCSSGSLTTFGGSLAALAVAGAMIVAAAAGRTPGRRAISPR